MKSLALILDNIRSAYNVGAILRTCDGLGVNEVVLVGCTPFLDKGLPHEQEKLKKQIHKTALGAEECVRWRRFSDVSSAINSLRSEGYKVAALEQSKGSISLAKAGGLAEGRLAIVLGEEVHGLAPEVLSSCDFVLEIPMMGDKESFNVSVAAGIVLWELRRKEFRSEGRLFGGR